jgi:hypothetical protein
VKGEACTVFWWGNLRERDHWGDPGVDGRMILRWIFRKWDVGVRTGFSWLRIQALRHVIGLYNRKITHLVRTC